MRQGAEGRRATMRHASYESRPHREPVHAPHITRRAPTLRRPDYIAVLGTHRAACYGDQHKMSGSESARATFVVMCCRATMEGTPA